MTPENAESAVRYVISVANREQLRRITATLFDHLVSTATSEQLMLAVTDCSDVLVRRS